MAATQKATKTFMVPPEMSNVTVDAEEMKTMPHFTLYDEANQQVFCGYRYDGQSLVFLGIDPGLYRIVFIGEV